MIFKVRQVKSRVKQRMKNKVNKEQGGYLKKKNGLTDLETRHLRKNMRKEATFQPVWFDLHRKKFPVHRAETAGRHRRRKWLLFCVWGVSQVYGSVKEEKGGGHDSGGWLQRSWISWQLSGRCQLRRTVAVRKECKGCDAEKLSVAEAEADYRSSYPSLATYAWSICNLEPQSA